MKVLTVLAALAAASAAPAERDKRHGYAVQYGSPQLQSTALQSNSLHSLSFQSNSLQSTSLQSNTIQPTYQGYQPAVQAVYSAKPTYALPERIYNVQNPVYTPYYPRGQVVYRSPVQTYTPVETYSSVQTYRPYHNHGEFYAPVQPVDTYRVSPLNWQGRAYGNNWNLDSWC